MKKLILGIIAVALFIFGIPKSNAILVHELESLDCTYGHNFLMENEDGKSYARIPEEYLSKGTNDEYTFIYFAIDQEKDRINDQAIKIKAYDYDLKCTEIIINGYNEYGQYSVWCGDIFYYYNITTFKILYKGNLYKNIEVEFSDFVSVYTNIFSYERFVNPKKITDIDKYLNSLKSHELNRVDTKAPNYVEKKELYIELGSDNDINDLIKIIKISDEYCGDLTGTALLTKTNLDINKIGDYNARILCQDYYGNGVYSDIKIHVVDFKDPIITGVNKYNVGIKKYITIDEIINNLSITDNSNLEPVLDITDNYTPNKNKVGEYEVIIKAIDQALNHTTFKVIVTVSDDVSPTIKGENIKAYMSKKYSNDDFYNFEIEDNVTEKNKIFKKYETNFDPTKKGEYFVKCIAKDEMGNESILEVRIDYIDDVAPIFQANSRVYNKYLSMDEIRKMFN